MSHSAVRPVSREAPAECVIMLGMHRSGTSACAGALRALGLSVGDDSELLPANEYNPRGYFEPTELVALDDRILAEWGGSWSNPHLTARPLDVGGLGASLRHAMSEYVQRWLARGQPFLWKDPRLCLTYRYWAPLLPRHVLLVVERDPREIAASLRARNAFPTMFSLALWEVYARAILTEAGGRPHHVIQYDRLLADPTGTVRQLADFLRGQHTVFTGSSALAEQHVDPELRHGRRTSEAAFELSPAQRRLHQQLLGSEPAGAAFAEDRPELLDAYLSLSVRTWAERAERDERDARVAERVAALEAQTRLDLDRLDAQLVRMVPALVHLEYLERRKIVRAMRWLDRRKLQLRKLMGKSSRAGAS